MGKVVLYESKDVSPEIIIDYEIVNDELYFRKTTTHTNKKDIFFNDDTENTYKLDKLNTEKLFNIINEKDFKNKFNTEEAFYDFRDFIDDNNLEHEFIAVDK